jgi:probable rRNA maturation factor
VIEVEVSAPCEVDAGPLVERLVWTCGRLGVERASVGLMVLGAEAMARLNGEHRGRHAATDVLSFPIDGADALAWPAEGPPAELGDLIICPEAADEPLQTLVIHGVLHLLGHDHETDAGQMLALQDRLVAEAGIAGP